MGREGSDEWLVGSCEWWWIRDERGKLDAPGFKIVEALGHLTSYDQAESALDFSSGLQALVFLPAWVRVGVKRVAGAAATVVAAECVFGLVAVFAVGEPVLAFVASVHSPVVAGGVDDLAPAWFGVSGAH